MYKISVTTLERIQKHLKTIKPLLFDELMADKKDSYEKAEPLCDCHNENEKLIELLEKEFQIN